jgi:chromate transport protein ChrA
MATHGTSDPISSDSEHGPVSNPAPAKPDVESQNSSSKCEEIVSTDPVRVSVTEDASLEDNSNVPCLSIPRIFWFFFYNFGLFAWGGPVAQIALIKERLVIQEKWITLARFQRVFSVYQILPGPEAAELCMFFGCLSGGRLGGIVAGLGFILPGFTLMLLASYVYSLAGFDNKYFNASFRALQPIVAAMVFMEQGAFGFLVCSNQAIDSKSDA